MNAPRLMLVLLLVGCFTLAARLVPTGLPADGTRRGADSVAALLLGEGRRLFANHLFVKADVYMHSGYYPTIFDHAQLHGGANSTRTQAATGTGQDTDQGFLGPPRDWLDRFGRNFYVTTPSHLGDDEEHCEHCRNKAKSAPAEPGHEHHDGEAASGDVREILPWLRLSAMLDPQNVETYTVAAYWLRSHLKRPEEAEKFLREGWRENPDSYEILFELGRVTSEVRHDDARARNLWELALRKWDQKNRGAVDPDLPLRRLLLGSLARLEERAGNLAKAIGYFELLKSISPAPETVQKQIDELRAKR